MTIKVQFASLLGLIAAAWLAFWLSGQPVKSEVGEFIVGMTTVLGVFVVAMAFYYTLFPSLRPKPRRRRQPR